MMEKLNTVIVTVVFKLVLYALSVIIVIINTSSR